MKKWSIAMFLILSLTMAGCGDESFKKVTDAKPIEVEKADTNEADGIANLKTNSDKVNTISATIVRVTDGDTFTVKMKDKTEKVRLLLVDTPESVKPNTPVEPYAIEASNYTKGILTKGKKVELEFDVNERDQYGRLLAYTYVDGEMLNRLLLEKGLAQVVIFQPNVKYVDEFRSIQQKAKNKGIGIWSDGKENKTNQTSQSKCDHPTIKGNINSRGDKIYHTPENENYKQTKPEAMFCTTEEAEHAGFRAAGR